MPADALVASDENASSVDGEQGPVVAPNKDLVSLHSGLKMTEQIMMQTLAKHGLERYDPAEKEERFDPNRHEASFMAPMQGKEDGVVFTTIQKGFILNGRVIRVSIQAISLFPSSEVHGIESSAWFMIGRKDSG